MTDLRTRIAAALTDQIVNDAAVTLRRYGANGEAQLSVDTNALADAVIRELGLERQDHYDPHCDYYRYVTDWIAPNVVCGELTDSGDAE